MTYKAAISGLKWGGGKAVIIGDSKTAKTPALLERFGEMVDRLGGNYITAKDVGIGSDDLRIVKRKTPHVLGIDGEPGSSGDPSPGTAWGVYQGIRASAQIALGAQSLQGLTIALQGLGSVSYYMLDHLASEGAKLIGCDVDAQAIARATQKHKIEIVSPDAIYDVACDIFSPCALGATINPQTRKRIKAKIIAGAANNQLATEEDGMELLKAGVTYAPDYAINAGGLINIYHESGAVAGGYNRARAFDQIAGINTTIHKILERAKAEKAPPHQIADKIAEERFRG
jgi:leucine dehydrogenase